MRKTPLNRRTPLRRGTKGLAKSRLSRMSPEKKSWMALYRAQVEAEEKAGFVRCAESGELVRIEFRERHHVCRRLGHRIMIYVYITKGLHRWIEDNVKKAIEIGWIRKEGEGYPKDPNQFRPWQPGTCVNEHLLD